MKINLTAVAALAFAFGCAGESTETGSSPTAPPPSEPSQEARDAAATVAPKVENVDAASAARLLADNGDVVVLDIRTPGEYERGHLKGAVNIDYRAPDFADKLGALDKDKTYLVH